ncbi:MAG: Gfo/Idh/MocA family protein [Gemmataceae bacterium]
MTDTPNNTNNSSRRDFLKASTVTASTLAAAATVAPYVHAQGNAELRVGLIGCGGRGTGAAKNALRADRNVKLVAMGDMYQDRLNGSLAGLRSEADIRNKVDVPRERQFTGWNAYQQVINSGVDVVLLATPPYFRPEHIEAAVEARKHVFAEKPVAVDGTGIRRVLAACQKARQRGLSVVSGLCWRYHDGMRQTFTRIQNGTIGDIVTMQCNYLTGTLWLRRRGADWTDLDYQVRNWLYYTWLSGDFNVEQHVHSLDKMAWAMGDQYPVSCYGLGGRQVRTDPAFGHVYDHMSCVYEYANGVKAFSHCRQMGGCHNEVKDYIYGTKGMASAMDYSITGETNWRLDARQRRAITSMYQQEHNELFASIRNNQPINNGDYMAKSSLMGIMGRMACYTGQKITWNQALNSTQELLPPRDILGTVRTPEVAMPGR